MSHAPYLNSLQSNRDCWWTTSRELVDNPNMGSPYRPDCTDHVRTAQPTVRLFGHYGVFIRSNTIQLMRKDLLTRLG